MARNAGVFPQALLFFLMLTVAVHWRVSAVSSKVLPGYSRTRVRVSHNSPKSSQSTESREVHCNITLDGEEIALRLVENKLLSIALPIFYTDEKRKVVSLNDADTKYEKTKFYQDIKGKAAVALTPRAAQRNGSETHDVEGLIFHENSTYRIRTIKLNSTDAANNHETTHGVKKINRRQWATDYIQKSFRSSRNLDANRSSTNTRQRRGTPAYEIELLYVLDYSTYQSFQTEMRFTNPAVTAAAVLQEMRYYYAQVSNGVDMRYRGITTAPWTMRTKLVAFYITTRAADSAWTESIRTAGGQNGWDAVNASAGLANFAAWASGPSGASIVSSLPSFDHAALFTMYDIFGQGTGGSVLDYNVIGLAYLGALCTADSASIVENTGALTEADTSAHEIGHSLGAEHDSEGNACSASSQYIMTAVSSVATKATALNYYLFSSCSINYFTTYIASLSTNCMTNTGSYFNATEWQSDMNLLPGQAYTPNGLCRQAFGTMYEACGGVDYGSNICMSLYCYNTTASPLELSCQPISAGGRGPDGMSCGNKRWCQSGVCVSNSSAPAGLDICPIGDFTRTMPVYSNQPYVCSNMPASYCYDQRVFNSCCSTCSNRTDASRPDCAYGDKINCSSVTPRDCPLNLANCCKTCSAFITTVQAATNTASTGGATQQNLLATTASSSTKSSMSQITLAHYSGCAVIPWLLILMHLDT